MEAKVRPEEEEVVVVVEGELKLRVFGENAGVGSRFQSSFSVSLSLSVLSCGAYRFGRDHCVT